MPETKSEQILKELQEKREQKKKSRKRRLSRIIMAFDALIILIILIILGTNSPEREYQSTLVNFSGTEIRFSLGESPEKDDYIFTLTFREASGHSFKKKLQGSLGVLEFFDQDRLVTSRIMGNKMKQLSLNSNEVRIFSLDLPKSILNDYLKKMGIVKKKKKSIVDFSGQYYKFKAKVTLNFSEALSIPLEINHEVKL